MATVDVIANRSTASEILGKAYFETDTNSFIVYNGSGWVELQSDGTGAAAPFNQYSLDLDGGDDYMDIGGSYDLGTFSAWFKPDSTLSSSVGPYMIAGFTGVGTYAQYGGIAVSGNITGSLTDEIITIYTGDWLYAYASSSATISNTAWHHVAVRWAGSDYEIYLDGSQVKNTDAQFGSLSKAKIAISNLSIGRRNDGGKFFPGLVDEVAIWSTPLSASDVTAIYNSGTPNDLTSYSPNGWWRMGDTGSDYGTSTITDAGSGGNDGTLINGPTFSTDIPS